MYTETDKLRCLGQRKRVGIGLVFSILFGGLIADLNLVECIFNLGKN